MAYDVGNDSGYKKGSGGTSAKTSSLMQKMQEEQKKKQAALQAQQAAAARAQQNRWGATDAQGLVNQTAAQKQASAAKFNWEGLSPGGYFNQIADMKQSQAAANAQYSPQKSYLNMYSDWQSQGAVPDVIPPFYPYRDSHGPFPNNVSQPNSVLAGYEPGSNLSGRDPYLNLYKDPTNVDLRPEQIYPYQSPGILPPGGGSGGGNGGGGNYDYPWEYPVYPIYSQPGGGGSKINEWYANMVQWNINRPKGG